MHRATPANTSFRAYTAGGARSCVHAADDAHQMQEMGGNFMKGESRDKIESPQNYGFTSVVADADKDGSGNVTGCAEAFITFCGGNRSFPVAGVMDDRRHRLQKLDKGDVAMFRQKDDKQQFHLTKDGGFWSAPEDKTVRMQLVKKDQQQQQGGGSGGGSGSSREADGGGAGGTGTGTGGQGQQKRGQESVYKDGKDNSYRYVDVTDKETRVSGKESHMMLEDKDSYVHCVSNKTYLGGHASKHSFARVLTEEGPATNVYGRVDGGGLVIFEDDVPKLAQSFPDSRRRMPAGWAKPALVPALALILGISLGVNYTLISASAASIASACMTLASR